MVTTMMKTTTMMETTDGRKTEMQHAAASAFAPPVIAAPPGQYDAGVEFATTVAGVEGDRERPLPVRGGGPHARTQGAEGSKRHGSNGQP